MRICVDLDGCLYDFVEDLRSYAEEDGWDRATLTEPVSWEFWGQWGMPKKYWSALFARGVNSGIIFNSCDPMKGGMDALHTLRNAGHSIHIITNREIGWKSQINTTQWISHHFVPHDTLTFSSDKTIIKTDIAIDDYPVNLRALQDAGTRAVCFDQPWNQDWEWEGERVSTWAEFVTLVHEAQS